NKHFRRIATILFGLAPLLFPVGHIFAQSADQNRIGFEKNPETTATYTEVQSFYRYLNANFDQCKLMEYGSTDFGEPLRLLVLSKDGIFDPLEAKLAGKLVLLINNGIHPGE